MNTTLTSIIETERVDDMPWRLNSYDTSEYTWNPIGTIQNLESMKVCWKKLGNAPEHQAYLRTDWLVFPKLFLNTQVNWGADWARRPGDPRKQIDDYTTVNLTLRYKDNKDDGAWNFAVGVRNLFDEEVRNPSLGPDVSGVINVPNDIPLAGRSYFVELGYRF